MNGKVFSDSSSIEKQLLEQAKIKGFADIISAMQIKD
jgi:hypothetical protein